MTTRYSRQQLFAPIGDVGQLKIQQARAFILGAGALGSSSSEMLVRAGIGHITIADRDIIEWTNLHRQQLYTEQDVIDQLPKAVAAEKRLTAINRDVQVSGIVVDITTENVMELLEGYDVIVDATDNIETRLLVNDAALKLGIPFFMGACVGSYGLTFPIGIQSNQPCLHCLLETLPAQSLTCDTVGVISPIVVTTAARQVTDILKYVTNGSFIPKLESADLWTGDRASMVVSNLKQVSCSSCGDHASYPFLSVQGSIQSAVLCGRDTVQLSWPKNRQVSLLNFVASVAPIVENLKHNPYLATCHFSGHRIVLFRDGRMLVHGTKNVAQARTIASKLLG